MRDGDDGHVPLFVRREHGKFDAHDPHGVIWDDGLGEDCAPAFLASAALVPSGRGGNARQRALVRQHLDKNVCVYMCAARPRAARTRHKSHSGEEVGGAAWKARTPGVTCGLLYGFSRGIYFFLSDETHFQTWPHCTPNIHFQTWPHSTARIQTHGPAPCAPRGTLFHAGPWHATTPSTKSVSNPGRLRARPGARPSLAPFAASLWSLPPCRAPHTSLHGWPSHNTTSRH